MHIPFMDIGIWPQEGLKGGPFAVLCVSNGLLGACSGVGEM